MFRPISKRMPITPSAVISVIALVFAMTGGAYAANKFLITSTKQISPKVLKSLKGSDGAKGASGANGATGPAGAPGPAGAKGETGASGPQGVPGTAGEKGLKGKQGAPGAAGATGEPWAPNNTLPSKATETGTWLFGPTTGPAKVLVASFPIQLAKTLSDAGCETKTAPCQVHFINVAGEEEPEPGVHEPSKECKGKVAEPTAQPGNLCIYTVELTNATTGSVAIIGPEGGTSAGKTGAIETFFTATGTGEGSGTWAVTAE